MADNSVLVAVYYTKDMTKEIESNYHMPVTGDISELVKRGEREGERAWT